MLQKVRATLFGTQKRQTITTFAIATVVFAVMSWGYIGNSLFTCGQMNIAAYQPGDGTAGLTWLAWIDKGGPLPGFTHLMNAPFGETLRDPFQITSMIGITGMWIFKTLTGSSICAWNLMVLVGYMSSALAMFAFIRWLIKNNWIAFFAACVVTYTPFHQFKSHGHLAYMFNAFLILALWAFIAFWRQPTKKNTILLAVATAACAYQDGYFLLLDATLVGSVVICALLADAYLFKRGRTFVTERAKKLFLYVGLVIVLVSPILLVQLRYSSRITSTLASTRGDIGSEAETYGARPIEYILPADNSPLLPQSYSVWREARLHGSNFTESTLFLGFVSMALAVIACVLVVRRKSVQKLKLQNIPIPLLVLVLAVGTICAFLVSLEPKFYVFGHPVPLPSWFIIHFTAVWRVFSRVYLVVDLLTVTLASIGLYLIVHKWNRRKQIVTILVVTAVALVELLTSSNRLTWNYHSAPAVYDWLRTQKSVKTIAEYPLTEQPALPAIYYQTYQQIHGKALINSSRTDSPQHILRASIQGLADAQTLPVLRTLGVDMVLVHGQPAPAGIRGLQLIRTDKSHYNDDIVYTYRILPGEKASYALVINDGFHLPEVDQKAQHGYLPMGTHGVLGFDPLTPSGAKNKQDVHVSLSVKAAKGTPKDQLVTFSQQGVVRWQGVVNSRTDVSFDADPTIPVDIIPYKAQTDTTIAIFNLKATQ